MLEDMAAALLLEPVLPLGWRGGQAPGYVRACRYGGGRLVRPVLGRWFGGRLLAQLRRVQPLKNIKQNGASVRWIRLVDMPAYST